MLFVFIGCTSLYERILASQEKDNSQCIPPTYKEARRSVGIISSIIGIVSASRHGHLEGESLMDRSIRRKLHDLRIEYIHCLEMQKINRGG